MNTAMGIDNGILYANDENAEMCHELWMRVRGEVFTAQRLRSPNEPLLLKSLVPLVMAGSTFYLPAVEESLRDFLPLDKAVDVMLAPLVNWPPLSYKPTDKSLRWLQLRLWAVPTNADGDCLLHAVSLCLWGQQDSTSVLRTLLIEIFKDSPSVGQLYRSWREEQRCEDQRRKDAGVPLVMEEGQVMNEWNKLVRDALRPKAYLSNVHVFALANALRRPIIVYGDRFIRDRNDRPFTPSDMRGIYLPVLLPSMVCFKTPIAVGYTCAVAGKVGHFTALVGIDGELGHLPLCDEHGVDLPVRYGSSSSMVQDYITTISCRTKEGMSYCMTKLPGAKMIPGAEGVQRSIELGARQQYIRSRKQVPTPSHALGDHLWNETDRSNSVMENSASAGNGGRGDVDDNSRRAKSQGLSAVNYFESISYKGVFDAAGDIGDNSRKPKSQGLPAGRFFETISFQGVYDTDTPAVETRRQSERVETGWRIYRPTPKYPSHEIDLSWTPFWSSTNDSGPDSSMVSLSAMSTGEDPLRSDDVAVGLTYQSTSLSTSMSKSSAGFPGEDECHHHSEDEASARTQGVAGLSASLLCWMTTTRRTPVAQTTATTRTSLNSLEVTSPPSSSSFSSRDSSGLYSHRCSDASPISYRSDSRPVSNSSTRGADFPLSHSLSLDWGWDWGKRLSHGGVVEGGGAGGTCSSGGGTAIANHNATSSETLSVSGLTTTSCVSAAVETWGKKNAKSSSSPPPPSPASRSDAMTIRKETNLESSAAFFAPPSFPVEAARVTTIADPSESSAHVSRVYSRTIKRRRTGVMGSGIVTRAESTDFSANKTLSWFRRKKSIAADDSALEAPKAAKEGQYSRAYHPSFC